MNCAERKADSEGATMALREADETDRINRCASMCGRKWISVPVDVMPGLAPGIHALACRTAVVDGRITSGHDEIGFALRAVALQASGAQHRIAADRLNQTAHTTGSARKRCGKRDERQSQLKR